MSEHTCPACGEQRQYTCDICDASFERYPSGVYGETAFCSRERLGKWVSEEFTGEGHPNWRGGGNEEYGVGWDRIRKRALERDFRLVQAPDDDRQVRTRYESEYRQFTVL